MPKWRKAKNPMERATPRRGTRANPARRLPMSPPKVGREDSTGIARGFVRGTTSDAPRDGDRGAKGHCQGKQEHQCGTEDDARLVRNHDGFPLDQHDYLRKPSPNVHRREGQYSEDRLKHAEERSGLETSRERCCDEASSGNAEERKPESFPGRRGARPESRELRRRGMRDPLRPLSPWQDVAGRGSHQRPPVLVPPSRLLRRATRPGAR